MQPLREVMTVHLIGRITERRDRQWYFPPAVPSRGCGSGDGVGYLRSWTNGNAQSRDAGHSSGRYTGSASLAGSTGSGRGVRRVIGLSGGRGGAR